MVEISLKVRRAGNQERTTVFLLYGLGDSVECWQDIRRSDSCIFEPLRMIFVRACQLDKRVSHVLENQSMSLHPRSPQSESSDFDLLLPAKAGSSRVCLLRTVSRSSQAYSIPRSFYMTHTPNSRLFFLVLTRRQHGYGKMKTR
jgi:hypothetical protein